MVPRRKQLMSMPSPRLSHASSEAPGVRLTAFAEVDEVLRSPFCQQASHAESAPFYADSLLLLEGERHAERRRLEARLFTREALEGYERDVLQRTVQHCLADLPRNAAGRPCADLVPLVERMLLQIAAAIVGLDGVDTSEAADRLGHLIQQISQGAHVEWSTRDHDAVLRETLVAKEAFVRDLFQPAWTRRVELAARIRAGALDADAAPPDLLCLLALGGAAGDDADLPVREAILYLMASTQTTSHATPHVVMEVTTWLAAHPESADRVTDSEFIRRAAAETLRLHTAVPALLRRADRELTLRTGRQIPAGQTIALDLATANTDPDVWGPDGHRFDPQREVPVTVRTRPWGLAFGSGSHVCIGRPLVTGLSNRTDVAGAETLGMLVHIVSALYGAGVEPDPDHPPRRTTHSQQGYYESFPVRFNA